MPIAVSNPNIDVYRFGGIVAVIVGSLVLLWLARKVLAGRGKGLASETKAILVGAFLINGARFAPWASVSFRHAHVLLWGDAFDTQALILLALGVYVSVILSQLWDA